VFVANRVDKMPDTSEPRLNTLNETISRKAEEWTAQDLSAIVESLRRQREIWEQGQREGSKKRVSSKKITIPSIEKNEQDEEQGIT